MGLGTDYIIKYLADTKDAVKGANDLERLNSQIASTIGKQYATATRIIGTDLQKISTKPITINGQEAIQTLQQVGTVAKTADGSFVQFTQTQKLVNGQLVNTTGSMKDVTNQFVKTNLEAIKGNKVFSNFADNVKQLAGRAILTIPIWIALRSAIMGTIQSFQDGIKNIFEFDRALQKVKRNMSGSTEEIEKNFATLRQEILRTSLTYGISTERIAEAIKKFASLGFSFEDSLAGGIESTKLATVLFGDAAETADSFARSLNLLIDRSEGAASAQKQMAEIFALVAELEKTNQFEINEANESLKNFAGTAKSFGLSARETIIILSTLGTNLLEGAKGGTLASTAFQQLVGNLHKVSTVLGLEINPESERMFDIFKKVISAIEELSKKDIVGATAAITELFGGVKGAKPVRALISDLGRLRDNLNVRADVDEYNKAVENMTKQPFKQIEIFHNLNKEIGKAFVTGVIGADNFDGALIKINHTLDAIRKNAENFGTAIRESFTISPITRTLKLPFDIITNTENIKSDINKQITSALKGELVPQDLSKLLSSLIKAQTLNIDIGIGDASITTAINDIKKQLLNTNKNIITSTSKINNEEQRAISITLNKNKLLTLEDTLKKQLSASGKSQLEIEKQILDLRNASGLFLQTELQLQKDLVEQTAALEEIELKRSRARGLIDNQLELLRIQGATDLQITKTRIELEKIYGINQSNADLLRNELELNKEITKEKLNQNKVSSLSMKLYDIAQTKGVEVAKLLAEALSGGLAISTSSLTSFSKNGYNFGDGQYLHELLSEFFPDFLKQLKAEEYFYRGEGQYIPIQERATIQNLKPLDLASVKLPDINTQIGNITVEIKKLFKDEDTSKQIVEAMVDAIRNNPIIETAINEKIDSF